MPQVSIIVPVYGVERYIERCAVSLFEQTYKDIEYIFVNDATPDKSIEILEGVIVRYPQRRKQVRVIHHPQNKGISATRNTGVQAVTGDYMLYVDSDDYVAPSAVERLVKSAVKNEADILLFDTKILSAKGISCESVSYRTKVQYIKNLLQHTAKCAHWNKFYQAAFYKSTNVLADERIRLADDYAVTPRIVHQAKKIAVLHEPLYFYETTNQSSYVHNLTRASIESQYLADKILIEYFTSVQDADKYADTVSALSQRSMVSLIKNAEKSSWPEIIDVYSDCLSEPASEGMTLVNRIIFKLAAGKHYRSLQGFLYIYHLVMLVHP